MKSFISLLVICTLVLQCLCADTYTFGNDRKNRPGRCPQLFDKLLRADCPSDCTGDDDCPGGQKCCENDCGGVTCLKPTEEVMCEIACPRNLDPVCAKDGVTYSNECMVKFAACTHNQNWIMEKVIDGPCAPVSHSPCQAELNKVQNGLIGAFVPKCDSIGFYAPLQCWGSTGMCWCADKNGKKITEPMRGYLKEEDCEAMLKEP